MMWPPGIQCQLCPMTFSDQSAINAHYDTAHAPSNTRAPPPPRPEHPDAKYPCDVCGRKFVNKYIVKRHLATVHDVSDVKGFQCDVCSKVFTEKGSLRRHLSGVHGLGDVQRFQCYLCPKVCNRKDNLKLHMKNRHNIS